MVIRGDEHPAIVWGSCTRALFWNVALVMAL